MSILKKRRAIVLSIGIDGFDFVAASCSLRPKSVVLKRNRQFGGVMLFPIWCGIVRGC